MNNCTYTSTSFICDDGNGGLLTIPALYRVGEQREVIMTITIPGDEQASELAIYPEEPEYREALAAYNRARQDRRDAARKQRAEEKPATGPKVEKLWIGTEITGNGWKILFDGGYDRTRVIFTRKPAQQAIDAVKAAGFFWSPQLKSWNKKLTCKAFRAAQDLSQQLRTICG